MKKNPDKNVLTDFPFRARYYLLHPWKFVRECWHNLQNAWFRATRGIAPVDLWSFDTHLSNLIPYGLNWLADNSHGWPQSEEFPEYVDWACSLRELAAKWQHAFCDMTDYMKENEYNESFHSLSASLTHHEKGEDGFWRTYIEETPEYLELRDKYFARMSELDEKYKQLQHECWVSLEKVFPSLWD